MNQSGIMQTIDYYLELLLRYRWFVLISFFLAMIAGIVTTIHLPRIYKSQTTILVIPKKVSDKYVTTLDRVGTKERINNLSQQIMSYSNLEKIINEHKLYDGPEFRKMFMEDKVKDVKKQIGVSFQKSSKGTDSFSISFRGKDPEKVKNVVESLATTFINENLKLMEIDAFGTTNFLKGEWERERRKLEEIEKKMEEYKRSHMGELPEQLSTNLRRVDLLQKLMAEKEASLRDAKNRLVLLQNRVLMEESLLAQKKALEPAPASSVSQTPQNLDQMQKMLRDLQSRYTDLHPDIVRLKKMIREMEAEKKTEREAAADILPKNDEQVMLQASSEMNPLFRIQQEEIKSEIRMLQEDIAGLRTQSAVYEKRIENTPKREAELLSLGRDYETTSESYQSLKQRYDEAEMAAKLILNKQGETFQVLDSAKVSQRPVSPNLLILFGAFCVFGTGIGGGIVFLIDFLDMSFKRVEDMESFMDLPVLSTIPVILQPRDLLRKRINLVFTVGFMLLDIGLFGTFALVNFKGGEKTLAFVKQILSG